MTRVALMIESDGGFKFSKMIEIPVTPRKGEKVDLGVVVFGLKASKANRARIKDVFQTVNGQGKVLETAILFDADLVSDEVLNAAIAEYRKTHPKD